MPTLYERPVSDGRVIEVVPMLFGNGRLCIGCPRAGSYDDVWCYRSMAEAIVAAVAWDPDTQEEPSGWVKHPSTGRRRPDADPAREVVRW